MGIKNLNKFIKKYANLSIQEIPLEEFQNKKVAIDTNLWLAANINIISNNELKNTNFINCDEINKDIILNKLSVALVYFIIKWLKYKIIPIFIFDGKSIEMKKETIDKRRKIKIEKKEKITLLKSKLKDSNIEDLEENAKNLEKEHKNYCEMNSSYFELIYNILDIIRIPYFFSKNCDAEKLCSMLCIEQIVHGVYSKDTDNLVYLCPILIRNFVKNVENKDIIECVIFDKILEESKFTKDQFIDFCILCGTDYNNNIPKYGIKRNYDLLNKHKSFNNFKENTNINLNCLNYEKCKEIFTYHSSNLLTDYDTESLRNFKFTKNENLYSLIQFKISTSIINTLQKYYCC